MKKNKKGSVVTIGVFDGVHVGHRKVITKAILRARALGLKSVVVTFDPHPSKILTPRHAVPMLMSLEHRIRIIKGLGADRVVVLSFTRSLSRLSPEDFVRKILVGRLAAREVYVGENFYFGSGGSSGANRLKKIAEREGLTVNIVNSVKVSGQPVSSSLIRKLTISGNLSAASKLLARDVSVLGTVVSGARLARELGYPTANINPHHEAIPPSGVYAVRVLYAGKMFKGILNIGTKPTFYAPRDEEPSIEVHIFGFNKNIYGKDLEILFVRSIRHEIAFKGKEALVERIHRDEIEARRILSF